MTSGSGPQLGALADLLCSSPAAAGSSIVDGIMV